MIPKKIHYCWFGGGKKSDLICQCIESWHKYAPDYEIVEWNESNYDVNKYNYTKEAYKHGKYAFVSDVARFDILHENGGIYLDTDVELIKSIDLFLEHDVFMGYDQRELVASGLIFGSVKSHDFLLDILEYYVERSFFKGYKRQDTTTVVTIVSDILRKKQFELNGLYTNRDGIVIYPSEYFDPIDFESGGCYITDNTYTIHHYAISWKSKSDMRIYKIGKIIKRIIGNKKYEKLARLKHRFFG